jgi:hypothetical protein
MARAPAAFREQSDPGLIDPVEELVQSLPCAGCGQSLAIGVRSQDESIWDPNALIRQNGIELAERSIFSAHQADIVQPDILEPTQGGLICHGLILEKTSHSKPGLRQQG